jgi:hypothetical protein
MESGNKSYGSSSHRDRLLGAYHERTGGLLVHAVDVCQPSDESYDQRTTTLRISNLADEYRHLDGEERVSTEIEWDRVTEFVEHPTHDVELLEAQDWGYASFGRIVAISDILERLWDITSVERTFIVHTSLSNCYLRDSLPDDELMESFREYDINVIDGSTLDPS